MKEREMELAEYTELWFMPAFYISCFASFANNATYHSSVCVINKCKVFLPLCFWSYFALNDFNQPVPQMSNLLTCLDVMLCYSELTKWPSNQLGSVVFIPKEKEIRLSFMNFHFYCRRSFFLFPSPDFNNSFVYSCKQDVISIRGRSSNHIQRHPYILLEIVSSQHLGFPLCTRMAVYQVYVHTASKGFDFVFNEPRLKVFHRKCVQLTLGHKKTFGKILFETKIFEMFVTEGTCNGLQF